MTIHLTFSKSSHLNTTLTDPSGNIHYTIQTSHRFGSRLTTVHRLETRSVATLSGDVPQPVLRPIGEIQHVMFGPSVLCFGFQQVSSKELFRRPGCYYAKLRYLLVAGQEYIWDYNHYRTKLYLNQHGNKTLVAKYCHPPFSRLRKKAVYLEITPEGEHIMDWIVFTFAYIQKRRQDEELLDLLVMIAITVATSVV